MLIFLLLAQDVPAGPPGDEPVVAPGCARAGEEIVVCAPDGDADAYRARLAARRPGLPPARARVAAGVTVSSGAQPGAGNTVVPRLMTGVTIEF